MSMFDFKVGDRVTVAASSLCHYGACGTIVGNVINANGASIWLHVRIDGNDPDIDYTAYEAADLAPVLETAPLLERMVGA